MRCVLFYISSHTSVTYPHLKWEGDHMQRNHIRDTWFPCYSQFKWRWCYYGARTRHTLNGKCNRHSRKTNEKWGKVQPQQPLKHQHHHRRRRHLRPQRQRLQQHQQRGNASRKSNWNFLSRCLFCVGFASVWRSALGTHSSNADKSAQCSLSRNFSLLIRSSVSCAYESSVREFSLRAKKMCVVPMLVVCMCVRRVPCTYQRS